MDFMTLIGLLGGLTIMAVAILANAEILDFMNLPGLLVVVAGTLAVTLIKYRWRGLRQSLALGLGTAFMDRLHSPFSVYSELREVAEKVRKQGLLGLEDLDIQYPFLRKAANLALDGHPPEFIENVLMEDTQQSLERLELAERVFRGIGDSAPALGMLGTLIGLVQMLNSLSDPSSIGPAMAIALLTTFYGAMIAQLIALPLAEKLAVKSQDEVRNRQIVIQGILSVLQGHNPRVLPEILSSYLPEGTVLSETSGKGSEAG